MAPLTSPESKPISSTNVLNEACPNPSSMFHFLFINITNLISKTKQTVCELLILKLHIPSLIVILMYRPPSYTINEFDDVIIKIN